MRLLLAALTLAAGAAAILPSHSDPMAALPAVPPGDQVATFAGGCFWSMQRDLARVPGVVKTTAGYAGGQTTHPTYSDVETGGTGHVETVRVIYDPKKISYANLLDAYWHEIDPFDAGGAFCDRGSQYRSMIFWNSPEQRNMAEQSKAAVAKRFGRPVATRITPARDFWPAEEYHQDYAHKHPLQYMAYRKGCGKDARLAQIWGSRLAGEVK